ncbi:MAG: hypothetical protein COB24_04875 [Hyphomicrobiales bacterium]|nr:MAG: hypothetical protein COB24_04875 [Hyphomicrobiales bacterium]
MLSGFSKLFLNLFVVIMLALLAGCASMVDSLTLTETSLIFDLAPLDEGAVEGRRVGFNLSISEPRAAVILDSDKVLVRPSPVVVQYYGDIIWADRIPKLVQRRIVQAFEDSKRVRSVAPRSDGFRSQYDLLIEIRDFHIEPSLRDSPAVARPIRVKVTFFAKLVSETSSQVVRSQKITKIVEVTVETRENIALAFNQAFAEATVSLVNWTLR